MDAVMGLVGAALITRWSFGLLRETSTVLLDEVPSEDMMEMITTKIEADADNRIVDLHLWQLGPNQYGVIISLVTHQPRDPIHYKVLLTDVKNLEHVTIEVNHCDGEPCI